MKRVDFIIEKEEYVLFLEVKDPDMPGASNPDKLIQELQGGSLIPELAGKYRDSLLFSHLRGEYNKPIRYVVLISMASLDDGLVVRKMDDLKSAIPITNKQWCKNAADSCAILKLDKYKECYGSESVWRASDYGD